MSIAERIAEMIPDYPNAGYCDDCIAQALDLSGRQEAQRVTSALAVTSEFQRWQDECELCGKTKLVICHAQKIVDKRTPSGT